MRILFVVRDYCLQNIPLQPWRYIHEIAHFLANTYHVHIVTDNKNCENHDFLNYNLNHVHPISPAKSDVVQRVIEEMWTDRLIWSVTPNSITYTNLFKKLNRPIYALVNYPLYTFHEIFNAQRCLPFSTLKQYYRYRLIPDSLFARFLNQPLVRGVITQSRRNRERLEKMGVAPTKLFHVPPGLDHERWQYAPSQNETGRCVFAYLGSPKKIRGIDILLKAFAVVFGKSDNIDLLILARDADDSTVRRLEEQTRRYYDRVRILGGSIEQEELKRILITCVAVVLPFVLVPSEMPFTSLEVMALGIPVISTDLDGIPEMVGDRGLVVRPGRHMEFAEAILRIGSDGSLQQTLRQNCISMRHYPSWQTVAKQFEEIVSSG